MNRPDVYDFQTLATNFLENKIGMSEVWLAELCISKFQELIRWNTSNRSWMIFDAESGLWEIKDEKPIIEMIRFVLDEIRQLEAQMIMSHGVSRASRIKDIERASRSSFIKGTQTLMSSYSMIQINSSEFDANKLLVGLQDGQCLDLKNCEVRKIQAADFLTKRLGCTFDLDASTEFWQGLVLQWANGDRELVQFLQTWAGYSLSGLTTEQAFLFLYGAGNNGKSVYVNTLYKIMGDYADSLNSDFLMQRTNSGGHSTEIAKLMGKRLVTSNELSEGKFFDEKLINNLTGGEVVTARHVFERDTSFFPQLKLIISGNHKPIVRGTSDGFWRRMRLVPFTASILRPDPNLNDKLNNQLSGVLNWMIQGWKQYQEENLIPVPNAVKSLSLQYRDDMDLIQQWINECIADDHEGCVPARDLYGSYCSWCTRYGFHPKSNNRFSEEFIKKTGSVKKRSKGSNLYLGFKLLS